MKNNIYTYTTEEDLNKIVCDLRGVELHVLPTTENSLKITCEKGKEPYISCNEGLLSVKLYHRTNLFNRRKRRVEILVPDHTVPEIIIDGDNCNVGLTGGIYGQFTLNCDDCAIEINGSSFYGCEMLGANLSSTLKGVTVKNALVAKSSAGDMIWENSFAACTECRVKRGNIGLSGFNCKDCILEAENGNVAARLDGEESDYNLGLLIKEGTANRESVQREGAVKTFKAYSAKGNIAIDFIPDDGTSVYGDM